MAKKASNSLSALELLSNPPREPWPVVALVGDEAFLRHEVRGVLASSLCDSSDDEPDIDVLEGKTAELRDVLDALSERSLFGGGGRMVVVEEADPLVKQHRERLEAYASAPRSGSVLVLEVSTLPSNTRLAKAVLESGAVVRCSVPQQGRELTAFSTQLKQWLAAVARREHEVELEAAAADRLLDLLPVVPGILYQEVGKLALLCGEQRRIDAALVGEHVGAWRARKTWDMIDAAADGRAAEALAQLDRLLLAGEDPHALLPQLASTLRRFAAAARLFEEAERSGRRPSLSDAIKGAGFPPFKSADAQRQLRSLGRARAKRLDEWVLAADLQIKGYNSSPERARRVLETLIVQLSSEVGTPVAGELALPSAW